MQDEHFSYSKTRIKEHVFCGFRLILFLYIRFFLQNQPEQHSNQLMVSSYVDLLSAVLSTVP